MFKYFIICASFLLVSCASKKNLVYVENTLKEKEYQNTQNEKLELENKLKKTEEQIKELNFIKQKLFDNNKKLENKETELKILQEKFADNQKEIEKINNEKTEFKKKLQKLEQNIDEVKKDKEKNILKIADLENKITVKEQQIQQLQKEIAGTDADVKVSMEKLKKKQEEINKLKKEKESLQCQLDNAIKERQDLQNQFDTKMQEFTNEKQRLENEKEKLEKSKQNLENEITSIKLQRDNLEIEKKNLEKTKDNLKQQIKNFQEVKTKLETENERLLNQNKELENKIKEFEKSQIAGISKEKINSSLKMVVEKITVNKNITDTIKKNNNANLNNDELEKAKNLLYGFYYVNQLNEIAKSNNFNDENVKQKLSYFLKEKLKFNNIVIDGNFKEILKTFNTEYDFNDSVIKIEKFLTAYENNNTTAKNLVYLYKDTDPSFVGETLPENITEIIKTYKEKLKIMKFLKDSDLYNKVKNDIAKLDKDFNEFKISSFDNKILEIDYDITNKDFNFIFNETKDNKISFEKLVVNKKDFSDNPDGFKTLINKRNLIVNDEYYNGFVKLNNYITKNGFADENEKKFRKNEIKNIINELIEIVNSGKDIDDAMEDDETLKQKYEKLKKLQDNELLDLTAYEDIEKLKLLQTILSKENFEPLLIYKEKEITDTIKLGDEGLGLKYSSFGLWKVEGKDKLSGIKELKEYFNVSDILPNETTNYYAFTYAVDEYQQRFMKNLNANDNDKIIFTGKNIAGVSNKNGKNTEFTGDAKLTVNEKIATADLNLNFKNWYEITYKDLDVGKKNGLTTNVKPKLNATNNIDNDFKFQNKDNIESKLQLNSYGYYKPEEIIGTFHINDNNLSADGAFGVTSKK